MQRRVPAVQADAAAQNRVCTIVNEKLRRVAPYRFHLRSTQVFNDGSETAGAIIHRSVQMAFLVM